MKSKSTLALLVIGTSFGASTPALADYTRYQSDAVSIEAIYANEWGSPFIFFTGTLNAECSNNGMYLYDITVKDGNTELRRNKMEIVLAAKINKRQVILDFFYDPEKQNSWDSCYIQGIEVIG